LRLQIDRYENVCMAGEPMHGVNIFRAIGREDIDMLKNVLNAKYEYAN